MLWVFFFFPLSHLAGFTEGISDLLHCRGGRFKAHLCPLPSVMTWQREEEEMQFFFSISVCRDVADSYFV